MKLINNKKPALLGVLMFAALGTLSNLPGAMDAIQSADLLSSRPLYLSNCPIDAEAEESECRVVHANKVAANVVIRKVVTQQPAPAPAPDATGPAAPAKTTTKYIVTSTLEADFCADGSCFLERKGINTLEDAVRIGKELSEKMSVDAKTKMNEEKVRLAKIKKCEMTEDGEEITNKSKILSCLAKTLKGLSGEEAADFYHENMRETIQELLQSKSPADRALAMGALGQIGQDMKINCATRPGMNQQAAAANPLMNHQNLNPLMNPMRPVNTAGTKGNSSRDLIAESACDMWAFGTYQNNLDYLSRAATSNPQAARQAMQVMKTGWGNYFQQRGFALQADPHGLNNLSGDLHNDFLENDAKMNANMQAVIDRHKDLMIQPAQQNGTQQPGTGRMARGGVMPQNGVGPGTPSVNPWPANGAGPAVPGRPGMQPAQPQGRYLGAPRLGDPVGGPRTGPPPPAPLRR